MFNAFHHFRPHDAMAVLRDAVQAGQSIGIFEISERSLRTLVPMFFLVPLLVAITTPFIRPFRWRRLLWTYLLPLAALWPEAEGRLKEAPELEAKALFEHLQERHGEALAEKHLRTFQRRVRQWRMQHGPDKEVFFPQDWEPGRALQLDWTHATELGVTLRHGFTQVGNS
jgi:hypothetical protein